MKITSEPNRVGDLLRFLRDGGYAAHEAGFGIVEIDLIDEARRPPKLESELGMWSAVNRTEVRIVTSNGSDALQTAEPAKVDARTPFREPLPPISSSTMTDSHGRTVVLLDRHPIWLGALEGVFSEPDYTVVGTATRLEHAIELVRSHAPDLLIAELPDPELGGVPEATFRAIRELRRDHRSLRVVVLSSSAAHGDVQQALAAGAAAYVLKTAERDVLASAARQAFGQSMFFGVSAEGGPMRADADEDPLLTRREREILGLVAEGRTTAELAQTLFITEQTVKFHLSNIYKKLGVSNRTQASRWAQRHGVVSFEDRSLTEAV